MSIRNRFSPETIERLRRRYEAADETVAAIAADEQVSEQKLHALKRACGWRPRSLRDKSPPTRGAARRKPRQSRQPAPGKASKTPKASPRASPPPPGLVDMPTLIARIRAQLEGALEAARARGPDANPDETARLMASLTRTLQSLRALEKDTTQDGRARDDRRDGGADAPPLDLAELRRELARRIDRLREDGESA